MLRPMWILVALALESASLTGALGVVVTKRRTGLQRSGPGGTRASATVPCQLRTRRASLRLSSTPPQLPSGWTLRRPKQLRREEESALHPYDQRHHDINLAQNVGA